MCEELRRTLARLGHAVRVARSLAQARALRAERTPDGVLLDLRLPDGSGIDFLEELKRDCPGVGVIVMTAYLDGELAVRSMRLGAADLLEKPFSLEQVTERLGAVSPRVARGAGCAPESSLWGESPAMEEARRRLLQAAATPATTVLLEGETGTGKELAACAIHQASARRGGPFVAVNCAALTETLLEAELFGYERGAFTGAATSGKLGLFEVAAGGTVLLDEIAELAPGLQAKLLRVLQERRVRRVGALEERPIDVRVIASTHRDLAARVAEGRFREDLYYRLDVLRVTLPPLRARGEDVPLLAQRFLELHARELGRPELVGFEPEALERLRAYAWPGNVRELRNAIERAVVAACPPRIRRADLTLTGAAPPPGAARSRPAEAGGPVVLELADHRLEGAERALIEAALAAAGGRKTQAAALLGINRATLYNKLRAYGLKR